MKQYKILFTIGLLTIALISGCGKKEGHDDSKSSSAQDSSLSESSLSNVNPLIINDFKLIKDSVSANQVNFEICEGLKKIDTNLFVSEDAKYTDITADLINICSTYKPQGSFLVASDEDIIFIAGLNSFEKDDVTVVNPYTTYQIASLTKQFTAASILKLESEGKLSTSDTLDQYFPKFKQGANITLDEMLHMRSGLVDYYTEYETFFAGASEDTIEEMYNGIMDNESFLSYLYKTDLKFEPDTQMQYCNTNYILLAMIIENISGLSYDQYVQQNFFDLCDMKNTSSCKVGDLTSKPAIPGGDTKLGKLCRGAGDMHSNVVDLLSWERMLHQGKVIDEKQLNRMFEMKDHYGYGFMGDDSKNHYHTGGLDSYEAFVGIFETESYGRLYLIQLYASRGNDASINAFIDTCRK